MSATKTNTFTFNRSALMMTDAAGFVPSSALADKGKIAIRKRDSRTYNGAGEDFDALVLTVKEMR